MFNFFKSKPTVEVTDKVWTDASHKLDGIRYAIGRALDRRRSVLLVGYFEETIRTVEQALRDVGLGCQRTLPLEGRIFCDQTLGVSARLWLLNAAQIEKRSGGSTTSSDDYDLEIIFIEHHPVASRDQETIEAVAALPCSCRISFHTSLDEPLMDRFGGDRIRSLMSSLGQEPDECIEHSMITSSIRKAQEKIEKKVGSETAASSAEDWFRFNLD